MQSKAELIAKIEQLTTVIEMQRAKTENDNKESCEDMYKLLADNSSDVIWKLDHRLRFTYVSPSLKKLTGFNPKEWIGTKLSEHTSSAEYIKMARFALRAFKSNKDNTHRIFITEFVCKDGTYIPVEITGNVIKNKEGVPIGLQGSTRDIRCRLETEKSLRESEERYNLALTAAQEGIWDWDLNNDVVYYSDQWKVQLGYLPNELENQFSTWQNLLHPMDYGRVHRELKKYISTPKENLQTTFRLRHKDGTYRYIQNRAASIKDKSGKVVRMFGAHTDITNQIIAEKALKESQQKLMNVISGADIILFSLDKKGVYTFSEGKGLEALRDIPKQVIGTSIFDVYKDYPQVTHLAEKALQGETIRKQLRLKDCFSTLAIHQYSV